MEYFAGIKTFTLVGGLALAFSKGLLTAIQMRRGGKLATALLLSDKKESKKELKNITGEGMQISEDITIKQKYTYEGICVFGPTGSGKTSSVFMPNLLNEAINGSLVVLDPKGELYRNTSYFQRTVCGRKVIRFAPLDPKLSSRYNLLESCKDTSEVSQLASTLLYNGSLSSEIATGRKGGGTEWITMAEPLLTSSLLYVRGLGKPFNTVEYALHLLIHLDTTELFYLFEYCDNEDAKLQFDIFKTTINAENTVSGIKITLASNIKLFTDYKINEVNSYNDFNFEQLRKEKTIVYITYPEHKALYISPYMASFFTQMLNSLIEAYKPGSQPITIFYDEFANIGRVSNMQGYASTVRSREINLTVCLQSITQLEQLYGMEESKSIINNLKTKVFLPGLSDLVTLNYASDLCGPKEIEVVTRSEDKDDKVSYSTSKSTRCLLSADEIRRLENNSLLIITSNRHAIKSMQNVYYENKEYLDLIKETEDIKIRTGYYSSKNKIEFFKLLDKTVELNNAIHLKNKEADKNLSEFMKKDKKRTTTKAQNRGKTLADEVFGD